MPFDASEVARQIEQSRALIRLQERAREDALALALRIYGAADETTWEQRAQDATMRRWVGLPLSALHGTLGVSTSGSDYCVAATDSSFIAPDKHRGSYSHLINVGRVMIRYGEDPAAELDSVPTHYPATEEDAEEEMSGRTLQTECALRELRELYEWSAQYRPRVALVDGSLMQLTLVLSKEEGVRRLVGEYFETIEAFRKIGVPVVGYISRPESQMVMRAVRMLGCDKSTPCEKRPDEPCSCRPLWSINDGELFRHLLDAGQRSAVFEPRFSYMEGQGIPAGFEEMVFTYMGTEYESARLEFPAWVWEDELLERVMSVILHQCKLGQGYPIALSRAHQFAALHNADREAYFFLLEKAGLLRATSEKAHGKRLIGQAI